LTVFWHSFKSQGLFRLGVSWLDKFLIESFARSCFFTDLSIRRKFGWAEVGQAGFGLVVSGIAPGIDGLESH